MTLRRLHHPQSALPVSAVLLAMWACAPARHAVFHPFLPPPPAAPDAGALVESGPPLLVAALQPGGLPNWLEGFLAPLPRYSEAGPILKLAESHFENGRRLYRAGEPAAARQAFDKAIEVLLCGVEDELDAEILRDRLADLVDAIHQYDISGLGAGQSDDIVVYDKPPFEVLPEPTFPIDPKLRDRVGEELKATVSQLPLELNDEVLRYINYFTQGRGRKILVSGLERAGRYRPMILRIFDEEGIPQELLHLGQAESGFSPRAVSRARATGMWQFMLSRGKQYGLVRTKSKDDRLDPEMATRAAAKHLKDLYSEFGDWYLAMAAYNCGPVRVESAVARSGYADFWELRRRNLLPRETANYVPIVLAMVIMSKNPSHYGLDQIESEPPLEYTTVVLDSQTHLNLIADITELPVSEIRALNPALLASVAPAGYALHIPAGKDAEVKSALNLIPPPQRTLWRLHRFAEGETLARIATRYRTTVQQITVANPDAAGEARPGSLLIVPVPATKPAAKKTASTKPAATNPAAKKTTSTKPAAKKTAPAPKAPAPAPAKKKAAPAR